MGSALCILKAGGCVDQKFLSCTSVTEGERPFSVWLTRSLPLQAVHRSGLVRYILPLLWSLGHPEYGYRWGPGELPGR